MSENSDAPSFVMYFILMLSVFLLILLIFYYIFMTQNSGGKVKT